LIGKERQRGDELAISHATRFTLASPGGARRFSGASVRRTSSRLEPAAPAPDNAIQLEEMRRGTIDSEAGSKSPVVTGCGLGVRSPSGYVLLPSHD